MSRTISGGMVPLSGRIEDDLYQWFISVDYAGAKSNSDKLREVLKEMRLQHQASEDFVKAQNWMLRMTAVLRQSLAEIDRDEMAHSEVFTAIIEHVIAMAAMLISARPTGAAEAAQIEEQLVRRTTALTEALLRQALTPEAAALDPQVINRHIGRSLALAQLINTNKQGDGNG